MRYSTLYIVYANKRVLHYLFACDFILNSTVILSATLSFPSFCHDQEIIQLWSQFNKICSSIFYNLTNCFGLQCMQIQTKMRSRIRVDIKRASGRIDFHREIHALIVRFTTWFSWLFFLKPQLHVFKAKLWHQRSVWQGKKQSVRGRVFGAAMMEKNLCPLSSTVEEQLMTWQNFNTHKELFHD